MLHRAHPFIVQNKWKQNDVHVRARGLGSGVRWVWNTRVCPCPPPPLRSFASTQPSPSTRAGRRCSAQAGPQCPDRHPILLSRGRAGAHRRGSPPTHPPELLAPTFTWPPRARPNRPRPSHCVSTPRSAACRAPGPDFGETQLSPPTPSVRVPSPSDAATLATAVHPPGPALHLAVIGAHSGLADAGVGGRWARAWWTGDAGKRGS